MAVCVIGTYFVPVIDPAWMWARAHNGSAYSGPPKQYLNSRHINLPIKRPPDAILATLRSIEFYVKPKGEPWSLVQTVDPDKTMFQFNPDRDGEYACMFVKVGKNGKRNIERLEDSQPQIILVVDTVPPKINIEILPIGNEKHLKCSIHDENADLNSIHMEYESKGQWRELQAISLGVFKVVDPSVFQGLVRANARDLAGHQTSLTVNLGEGGRAVPETAQKPTQSVNLLPDKIPDFADLDPSRLPTTSAKKSSNENPSPDATSANKLSPYSPIPRQQVNAKKDAGNLIIPPVPSSPVGQPPANAPATQKPEDLKVDPFLNETANDGFKYPADIARGHNANPQKTLPTKQDVLPGTLALTDSIKTSGSAVERTSNQESANQNRVEFDSKPKPGDLAVNSRSENDDEMKITNNRFITLKYEIENASMNIQPKIEYWAINDKGMNWSRLKDTSHTPGQPRLELPGEGCYGIFVKPFDDDRPPHKGEAPQAWIEVDMTAPVVNLSTPKIGPVNHHRMVTINWTAADKNLVAKPITLYYAKNREGPWITIDTGIMNNGSYNWLVPSDAGSMIYLGCEAVDRAGNKGRHMLSNPILLPSMKIRVTSIEGVK